MPSYENAVKFEKEAPPGVVRLVMGNGFYRAYNRSAWLFHCCIAEHKVTRKYVGGEGRAGLGGGTAGGGGGVGRRIATGAGEGAGENAD